MLADNVSGHIRSDFFASIANKDMTFFDEVNVGEICKSQVYLIVVVSGKIKLGHTGYQ